jgi:Protein of unknown function (DUF3309)
VLILGLALFVTIAGIALFPCWPYSRKLGFGPSLAAGSLLVVAALLAMAHKTDNLTTEGPTKLANTSIAATAATIQPISD